MERGGCHGACLTRPMILRRHDLALQSVRVAALVSRVLYASKDPGQTGNAARVGTSEDVHVSNLIQTNVQCLAGSFLPVLLRVDSPALLRMTRTFTPAAERTLPLRR
jgi:hypothetical protein